MSTRPILMKTGAVVASSALLSMMGAGAAFADDSVEEPSSFTSMFTATATPDMVVDPDEGEPSPGEEGAEGMFNFQVNSDEEIICYDITLDGVTPPYESPARTATHIHEAGEGEPGPPRIAFPDPEEDEDGLLHSSGCMQGPFTTGVEDDETGEDSGEGFTLSQIEDDPSAFFADTHTEDFPDGAVRGQLEAAPEGGVETGAGGAIDNESKATGAVAAGVASIIAASGVTLFVLWRRAGVTS